MPIIILKLLALLGIGYGVATVVVPEHHVEIASVKICNQHDEVCKSKWPHYIRKEDCKLNNWSNGVCWEDDGSTSGDAGVMYFGANNLEAKDE